MHLFYILLAACHWIAVYSRTDVCVKTDPGLDVDLKYDEALFQIKTTSKQNDLSLKLMGISTLCYKCHEQLCGLNKDFISVVLSTRHAIKYSIYVKNDTSKQETQACRNTYKFEEHGHYLINVDETVKCSQMIKTKNPDFTYLPLVVMFAIIIVLVIIYNAVVFYLRKRMLQRRIGYTPISDGDSDKLNYNSGSSMPKDYSPTPVHPVNSNGKPGARRRIRSLDTFRGISIVIMIFVNYTGGRYWFFNHSSWNGLTVADLVFPWFIFIMGSSIFISFRSLRRKHISKKTIALKITYRALKLLVLGLFLNNGQNLSKWRIPGVLQRFALSYFVVAMVNLLFSPEEDEIDTHYNYDWRDAFRDLTWFRIQHIVMALFLLLYLLIAFLVHDPNCPKGYFGPGGIGDHGNYTKCTGGAARYIDIKVFGVNHIYQGPTCKVPYQCVAHDPEGLLGVIPSILLAYLGLQAARILFLYSKQSSHIKRWLVWAVIWGAIAWGLCGGKQNGGIIPVNKNLWSLSFILATGSMAYILLAICYVTIDVLKWWNGVPFYFAGMNAILLYVGHEILRNYFPFNFTNNGQHSELLARAAIGAALWTFISYLCFRTGVFLKL